MRVQSAEDVIELVDLGDACETTRQLAPFVMTCDNMYAYMGYRREDGC